MSTTSQLYAPVRPGPGAWWALMVAEAKMVARDTGGLVIPLGMPLLILVMNAVAFDTDEVLPSGATVFAVYVLPVVLTMVIATVGVINMPSFLATYRRSGILRRLGVTPASPPMVLVAQAVVGVAQIILGIALALAAAFWWFGATAPEHLGATVGVLALSIASMYAVGMLVAAISPTPQSAVAFGLIAFFALAAVGGMFGPRENLPEWLAEIGGVLPFGATVDALGAAWSGQAIPGSALMGMIGTALVAGSLSALWFRWE